MTPVYWECKVNNHHKFWAAQIIEKKDTTGYTEGKFDVAKTVVKYVLVRKWGKIGTNGQTMEQEFDNKYEAEDALKKLIWDKENKGYKPVF